MKTSKYLALGLVALLALSLVSCGGQQAQEPQEPKQEVQQTEPVTTEPTTPPAQPEQLSDKERLEKISHDELIAVFEQQYEISKEINNSDSEETIQSELMMIETTVACMNKSLPSDYESQYRAWRPSVVQQDTQTTETTQQNQQTQNQQNQGQQGQSSKPQGGQNKGGSQTQQPPQQQQGDSSGDEGMSQMPSYRDVITDPSQIDSGTSNPYSGYGEVGIGYGG